MTDLTSSKRPSLWRDAIGAFGLVVMLALGSADWSAPSSTPDAIGANAEANAARVSE